MPVASWTIQVAGGGGGVDDPGGLARRPYVAHVTRDAWRAHSPLSLIGRDRTYALISSTNK